MASFADFVSSLPAGIQNSGGYGGVNQYMPLYSDWISKNIDPGYISTEMGGGGALIDPNAVKQSSAGAAETTLSNVQQPKDSGFSSILGKLIPLVIAGGLGAGVASGAGLFGGLGGSTAGTLDTALQFASGAPDAGALNTGFDLSGGSLGGGGTALTTSGGGTSLDMSGFNLPGGGTGPVDTSGFNIPGAGGTPSLLSTGTSTSGMAGLLQSMGLTPQQIASLTGVGGTASGVGSLVSGIAGLLGSGALSRNPSAGTQAQFNPFQGQYAQYQPQLANAVTNQSNLLTTGQSPGTTALTNALNTAGGDYVTNKLAAQGLTGSGNAALQQGQFAAGNYATALNTELTGGNNMISQLAQLSGATIGPGTLSSMYPNPNNTTNLIGNSLGSIAYGGTALAPGLSNIWNSLTSSGSSGGPT